MVKGLIMFNNSEFWKPAKEAPYIYYQNFINIILIVKKDFEMH